MTFYSHVVFMHSHDVGLLVFQPSDAAGSRDNFIGLRMFDYTELVALPAPKMAGKYEAG